MLRDTRWRALWLTASLSVAACASRAPAASRVLAVAPPALHLDATASGWGPWRLRNRSDAVVIVESAHPSAVNLEVMDASGAWRAVSFRMAFCTLRPTAEERVAPGALVALDRPAVSAWLAPVGRYRARVVVRSPPSGPRWEVTTRFDVQPADAALRARARALIAEGIRAGCQVDRWLAAYLFVAPTEDVLSFREGSLLPGVEPFFRYVLLARAHIEVLAPLLQEGNRARAFLVAQAIRVALSPPADWIDPQIEARVSHVLDSPRPNAVDLPAEAQPSDHPSADPDVADNTRCDAVDASLGALLPPRDDGPPTTFPVEGSAVRMLSPNDATVAQPHPR